MHVFLTQKNLNWRARFWWVLKISFPGREAYVTWKRCGFTEYSTISTEVRHSSSRDEWKWSPSCDTAARHGKAAGIAVIVLFRAAVTLSSWNFSSAFTRGSHSLFVVSAFFGPSAALYEKSGSVIIYFLFFKCTRRYTTTSTNSSNQKNYH